MSSFQRLSNLLIGISLFTIVTGCTQTSTTKDDSLSASPTISASTEPTSILEHTDSFLSFHDDADREVVLKKQPERVIVLSPQLLDLLYAVEGRAVARATSTGAEPPEEAKDLEDVGGMTTVNTEKLLALNPDLVIGSTSFHRELEGILDASHIPFALFSLSTYQDLKEKAPIFGKLAGTESKANEELDKLDKEIQKITAKLPEGPSPTFVMLNVTPSSVSVQRTNTIGLEVADMLRMVNVAETLEPSQKSPNTVPYSLEKLVELDPDYVFILIHGAQTDGEKKIQSDLASQPAWASLRAVKEERMAILPSDLLLSNPGFRLNESVDYLAKLVYPEIFGDAP